MTEKTKKPQTIDIFFMMKEVKWSDDYIWRMKLQIPFYVEFPSHIYETKFYFNEKRYDDQITELQEKIQEIEGNPSLLEEYDGRDIQKLKDEISEINHEKKEMMDSCPEIEFMSKVEKIEYKRSKDYNATEFVFSFDKEVIPQLSGLLDFMSHYKVLMKPYELKED